MERWTDFAFWCRLLSALCVSGLCAVPPLHASPAKEWKAILDLAAEHARLADGGPADAYELQGTLVLLQHRLETFVADYPSHKQWWIARAMLPEMRCQAALAMGHQVDWAAATLELENLLAEPELPDRIKPDVEFAWISLQQKRGEKAGLTRRKRDELWLRMEMFGNDFPRHRAAAPVHLALARNLLRSDPERAGRLLLSARKKGTREISVQAERELAVLPYRNAPLDLEFRDMEGREVRIADLKGQVVLVDFWATWCGPCVRDMPRVIGVYQEYREKGFTIVSISLDEDRHELAKFISARGMDWPQYFDGRGWDNKISRRFGISSIPEMWLLDREGRVASTDIWGGNLEYHVRRLLLHP